MIAELGIKVDVRKLTREEGVLRNRRTTAKNESGFTCGAAGTILIGCSGVVIEIWRMDPEKRRQKSERVLRVSIRIIQSINVRKWSWWQKACTENRHLGEIF